jgi:hypothetical protein
MKETGANEDLLALITVSYFDTLINFRALLTTGMIKCKLNAPELF